MVTESILYKNKASERGYIRLFFGHLWLSLVIFGGLKGYLEYNVLRVCLLKIPPIGEMLKNPKKPYFGEFHQNALFWGIWENSLFWGILGKGVFWGILVKCSFLGK